MYGLKKIIKQKTSVAERCETEKVQFPSCTYCFAISLSANLPTYFIYDKIQLNLKGVRCKIVSF